MIVYKYALKLEEDFKIELPKGAELLTVASQENCLYLWAKVDQYDNEKELRRFAVYGTGHDMYEFSDYSYIGTAHTEIGFVFHVFEII